MNTKWNFILFATLFAIVTAAAAQEVSVITSVSGAGGITAVNSTATAVSGSGLGEIGGVGGSFTFDLRLDSASDILVVNASFTDVVGTIYNNESHAVPRDDHTPPIEALEAVFGKDVDLWVTTPGVTGAADPSRLTAGETVTHFDTTDDGAQTNFRWANVTLIPNEQGFASATLNATFQTAAEPMPIFDDVTVVMTVPEPAASGSGIILFIVLFRTTRRRRTKTESNHPM